MSECAGGGHVVGACASRGARGWAWAKRRLQRLAANAAGGAQKIGEDSPRLLQPMADVRTTSVNSAEVIQVLDGATEIAGAPPPNTGGRSEAGSRPRAGHIYSQLLLISSY